jgi:hypothetical protein
MRSLGRAIGLTALALAGAGCFRTSDAEMIGVLEKHRSVLEEIVRMCRADHAQLKNGASHVRVPDDCNAWREGDVAKARCVGDYRPLKNKAGLSGEITCGDEAVAIGYRGNMMAMGGWLKGFEFNSKVEPSVNEHAAVVIADRIDDALIDRLYRQHKVSHLEIYRDIGDGWFIYYVGDS